MSMRLDFTRNDILNAEFIPTFKPIIDLRTSEIVGVEAIGNIKSNNTVIPAYTFESYSRSLGVLWQVDMSTLEVASMAFNELRMGNKDAYALKLHVNISSSYLDQEDLVHEGINAVLIKVAGLGRGILSPRDITLEINNDGLVEKADKFISTATSLKKFGYDIILDGYAGDGVGMAYLRDNLTLDGFKLDKAFIVGIAGDRKRLNRLNDLAVTAQKEDIRLIADGIDSSDERKLLDNHSEIPWGQGRYKPMGGEMSAADFILRFEQQTILKKIAKEQRNKDNKNPPALTFN